MGEFLSDALYDRGERAFYLSGRDGQHAVTRRRQAAGTLGVCAAPLVPGAVDLYDEMRLRRVEVRDVALKYNLPPERDAELLGAQRLPQQPLRGRGLLTYAAGSLTKKAALV